MREINSPGVSRLKPTSSILTKQYHFASLPLPEKMTAVEAEQSACKMDVLLRDFRRELFHFCSLEGFKILGYKNMPAFIKSRIQEISPRYANSILEAAMTEYSMKLNMPLGTISYTALKVLMAFPIDVMNRLWTKAASEIIPGENQADVIKRIVKERSNINK